MTVALVLGAAMLLVAVGATFLGIGALDLGSAAGRSGGTFAIADACVEETLERIRRVATYGIGAGTIPLVIGPGSCAVTVEDIGGNQRRVTVIATLGAYQSRLLVTVTVGADGTLIVSSWDEIAA